MCGGWFGEKTGDIVRERRVNPSSEDTDSRERRKKERTRKKGKKQEKEKEIGRKNHPPKLHATHPHPPLKGEGRIGKSEVR